MCFRNYWQDLATFWIKILKSQPLLQNLAALVITDDVTFTLTFTVSSPFAECVFKMIVVYFFYTVVDPCSPNPFQRTVVNEWLLQYLRLLLNVYTIIVVYFFLSQLLIPAVQTPVRIVVSVPRLVVDHVLIYSVYAQDAIPVIDVK